MSGPDQLGTPPPVTVNASFFCAGRTRFDRPCTNRVRAAGAFCGRCQGSRLAPTANTSDDGTPATRTPPSGAPAPAPVRRLSRRPAGAGGNVNEWTVANELVARLTPLAGDDAELLALVEVGARLAENSRAQNTKASYRQHWRTFESFGDAYGLATDLPVDPAVIAYFVAFLAAAGRVDRQTGDRAGDPLSTGYTRQAIAAIGHRHRINGHPDATEDPIVRGLLEGYAKQHGTDVHGKDPIRGPQVALIAEALSQPHPTSARDLAICLLATRPDLDIAANTLVSIDGEHVQFPEHLSDPMTLLLKQRGTTALSAVDVWPEANSTICPVGAMRALGPHRSGPVFRSSPTKRLTRNGLLWALDHAVARAGLHPRNVSNGLPKLRNEERAQISAILGRGPTGDLRDRALITNLYWGCFRASELVERDWNHARFVDQGIEWKIPKDKTNQEGHDPRITGIPRHPDPWLCPVLALEEWRSTLEGLLRRPVRGSDPIFPTLDRRTRLTIKMSVQAANAAVQLAAARIGLDGDFGSHSLRTGFTTDALNAGSTREHVQHHGGWKNAKSLDSYIRKSATWADTNPALVLLPGPH